jgi:hypothetical protein
MSMFAHDANGAFTTVFCSLKALQEDEWPKRAMLNNCGAGEMGRLSDRACVKTQARSSAVIRRLFVERRLQGEPWWVALRCL